MNAATAPNKKEIRSALNKAGLSKVDNDALSKCVALASTLHLTPETMAEVWEAYSLNKQNLTELTMHSFEAYKNELVKVSSVTPASEGITSSTKGAVVVNANKHKRDAASAAMVTPVSTAKRHQGNKDASDKNNSSVDQVAIQGAAGSPNVAAAKKPTIVLPKYQERTKVGQVVVSYPAGKTSISKTSPTTSGRSRCVVSAKADADSKGDVGHSNITKPYRHMFTTLEDRATALEKLLVDRKEAMVEQHGLSATQQQSNEDNNNNATAETEDAKGVFAPLEEVNVPRQEKMTCIGRVCNEAHQGKLNASSVVLEGSSASCGGARINVDLSHMKTTNKMPYSLFPGQIVAVEGMNGTGRKITAHRVLEGAPPTRKTTSVRELRQFHYDADKQDGKPIKIITASGPFTTSQSMDYEPFIDLMHVVLDEQPDVVVLTGPFVDMRQSAVQSGNIKIDVGDEDSPEELVVSFEAVFAQKISALIEEALMASDEDGGEGVGLPTQFVLVPAMEDATAKWVYPQPPLEDRLPKGGKFLDIPGADAFEFGSMGLYRLQEIGGRNNGTASRRVHCLPNPCTFQINEVVFGVTSTDVLFHMSADETNANLVPGSRLRHIAQHLVQQQSFYPLFPPSKSVNLDLKQSKGWRMPFCPDVLVIPSKLTTFCSPILESTMAVNPGHLTKGTTGGTYAVMEIKPMSRDVLDEATDDVELPHNVPDRIQVE
ncbi:MAG: hypothetical protein SGILL_009220, partial [Bacillariaceae sp.]